MSEDLLKRPRTNPELCTFEKQFSQEADCNDCNGPEQFIVIKQEDGGGGPFWVIETERWAINDIEDAIALLERAGVQRRAEMEGAA